MEAGLVRFVESRAQALKVEYGHTTPPQALLEATLAAEHKDISVRGTDAMPACFGMLFAGPYDSGCDQCQVQMACCARFAWDRLPELAAQNDAHTAADLGELAEVDPKAVVLAQTFAAQASGRERVPFGGYKLIKAPQLPKVTCLRDIPRPFALAAYAALLGSRAGLRVWNRDVRLTTSHGTPELLGLSRAAYFRGQKKTKAWCDRYMRERKRHILYASLKTGMLLRKVHRGILHEVRCGWRCYEYEDQAYPTLYAVVQAIAGSTECQHQLREDGTRAKGTRHTATRSPLNFFYRSFQQLVHRMPPKRKKRRKKKAA